MTSATTDLCPRLALLLGLLLTGACTSLPVGAVPDPLPEALAWELPADGGAFLGVHGEENDSGSLDALFFEPGVRVVRVVENSPAARAGLAPRDVVLSLGGLEVNDPAALDALVAEHQPGQRVELSVQRDDTVFAVELELAARSGEQPARVTPSYRVDAARSLGGWATAPGGVRLVARHEQGPLARASVAVGSTVRALDGQHVLSARELLRQLQAREPGQWVTLSVRPPEGGPERQVAIRLADVPRRLTEAGVFVLFDYSAEVDGSRTRFSLIDLWFFELFQWERDGAERRWVLFELFGFDLIGHASDVGTLGS